MRSILPIALILSLAACSEPPAETPAPSSVITMDADTPPAPEPVADSTCAGASLAFEVTGQDAGAGNRFATLALRNVGTTACTLQGYPELQLIGADDQPRSPFRFEERPDGAGIGAVTLEPNGQAWFDMRTTVVAGEVPGETEPCPAVTAVRILARDATVDAAIQLNPCNQRASITPFRSTAELPPQ